MIGEIIFFVLFIVFWFMIIGVILQPFLDWFKSPQFEKSARKTREFWQRWQFWKRG